MSKKSETTDGDTNKDALDVKSGRRERKGLTKVIEDIVDEHLKNETTETSLKETTKREIGVYIENLVKKEVPRYLQRETELKNKTSYLDRIHNAMGIKAVYTALFVGFIVGNFMTLAISLFLKSGHEQYYEVKGRKYALMEIVEKYDSIKPKDYSNWANNDMWCNDFYRQWGRYPKSNELNDEQLSRYILSVMEKSKEQTTQKQ